MTAETISTTTVTETAQDSSQAPRPPEPLPTGWIRKESLSQPGYFYFFNYDTGVTSWQRPAPLEPTLEPDETATAEAPEKAAQQAVKDISSSKRPREEIAASNKSHKRSKPSQVRVLHILKKHKDSKRPSSWRNKTVTQTRDEAAEELQGLLELLQGESGDELRATFEELARTESDCSSHKRGGDLGFFGPRKMQPEFEEAAFDLEIGQLSGLVDTKSGVHVLLRIG